MERLRVLYPSGVVGRGSRTLQGCGFQPWSQSYVRPEQLVNCLERGREVGCQGFQLVAMLMELQEGCPPSMQWECLPFRPSTLGSAGGSEQHPVTVQTQAHALANINSFAGINAQSQALQEGRLLIWGV